METQTVELKKFPTREEFNKAYEDPTFKKEFEDTLAKAKTVAVDIAAWADGKEIKGAVFHMAVAMLKDVLDEEIGLKDFMKRMEG